jgi:hypothetical protein
MSQRRGKAPERVRITAEFSKNVLQSKKTTPGENRRQFLKMSHPFVVEKCQGVQED